MPATLTHCSIHIEAKNVNCTSDCGPDRAQRLSTQTTNVHNLQHACCSQVLGETWEGEQVEKLLAEADILKDGTGKFSTRYLNIPLIRRFRYRVLRKRSPEAAIACLRVAFVFHF